MAPRGTTLTRRILNNGQDRQNGRSQETDGHFQEYGLSQMLEADPHRQARERPRTQRAGRHLHLVFGLRLLREAVTPRRPERSYKPDHKRHEETHSKNVPDPTVQDASSPPPTH